LCESRANAWCGTGEGGFESLLACDKSGCETGGESDRLWLVLVLLRALSAWYASAKGFREAVLCSVPCGAFG